MIKETDAYVIVNHLQFHFGDVLERTKKINIFNAADVCGVCLHVEYYYRYQGIYELSTGPAQYLGWETIDTVFKLINADDYISLLNRSKAINVLDESDEVSKKDSEILFEWNSKPLDTIFNKCVDFLSKNSQPHLLEETMSLLPPLPNKEREILEAAGMADYEWIKRLLDAGANPNITDGDNTPLSIAWYMYSASYAPPETSMACVKLLIESGSDPLLGDNKRMLRESLFPFEEDLFKMLLEYGWDINYYTDESPVFILVRQIPSINKYYGSNFEADKQKYIDRLDYFLQKSPNLNDPTLTDDRLLPLSISEYKEVSEKLLNHGAKLQVEAQDGFYYLTPLMMAVSNGKLDDVKYWVEKGVGINCRLGNRCYFPLRDNKMIPAGFTALDIAKVEDKTEIVNYLESHGAISGEQISWKIKIVRYNGNLMNVKDIESLAKDFSSEIQQVVGDDYKLNNLEWNIKYMLEEDTAIKTNVLESSDKSLIEALGEKLKQLDFDFEVS
ncbi:hypothetical protein V6R21_24570 [Limibacter armeniacum]|uniref:ankyrin repeat domain-containing protein n=1 Tax=Limibacter armeniacum TaxID=466084 RepID=UPI002FE5CD4D